MTTATGLLAVWMQIPAEMEDDLNAWYTKEHLPERIALPGFQTALRYVSLQGEPKYMALYDLDSTAALYTDEYKDIRRNATDWTRRIGRALAKNIRNEYELIASQGNEGAEPAPYVVLLRTNAEPAEEAEAWLAHRYLPAVAGVPGVRRARAYRATVGGPRLLWYVEFESDGVFNSEAWRKAEAEAGVAAIKASMTDVGLNYGRFLEAATRGA